MGVGEALLAEILPLHADLVGELREALAQEPRAHVVALGDELLAAQKVGHPELQLAGPGDDRQAVDLERPGRDLLEHAARVVEEDLGRRGLVGEPADRGQGEGDEGGVGGEVAGPLQAGKAHRPAERAARGQAVADAQARALFGKVPDERGVEADELALVVDDVAGAEVGDQHAGLVEGAELEQRIQPLAQALAREVEDVVVEIGAGAGARRQIARPSARDRARLKLVGRQGQLDRERALVELLLEARQRVERIEGLAVQRDDVGLVQPHPPGAQIQHARGEAAFGPAQEQGTLAHRLAVQDHPQQPLQPLLEGRDVVGHGGSV